MITSEITSNILYKICKEKFDLPIYQTGAIPEGEVKEPRIVVQGCDLNPETYWEVGTAEINFVVPNLHEKRDKAKLDEYSVLAKDELDHGVGEWEGDTYKYSYKTSSIKEDTQLRSHFVNVLIEFKVLNIL